MPYRHTQHAGNHADVFKHSVLVLLLRTLLRRESGSIDYLESHAGRGSYPIAGRTRLRAIHNIWEMTKAPRVARPYLRAVHIHNENRTRMGRYPGSPWLAQQQLRKRDQLYLYERQESEFKGLSKLLGTDSRITLTLADGFKGLPLSLRKCGNSGLALIDPPYESSPEYKAAIECLDKCSQLRPKFTFALWYPLLHNRDQRALLEAAGRTAAGRVLDLSYNLAAAEKGNGMAGAGLVIISPPPNFDREVQRLLAWLTPQLSNNNEGHFRAMWLPK